MGPVTRAAVLALACATAIACTGAGAFACMQDAQCAAAGSVCQPDGWCSFLDEACPSGFRYGEHAGDGLGGTCVPAVDDGTGTPGTSEGDGASTMPVLEGGPVTEGSSTLGLTAAMDDDTTAPLDPSTSGAPLDDSASGSETGEPGDPSLVAWYPFDDATDPYADASGNGLHAWCGGAECPQYEAGVIGGSVVFDGIDDHLHVDHHPSLELTESFSIALWVRVDLVTIGDFRTITSKPLGPSVANSWEVGMPGSMHLYAGAGNLLDFASAQVPLEETGVWHHLALTWGADEMLLWLDGVAVGSAPTILVEYDDHPMMIGADIDDEMDDNFLTGKIDDLRLYDRVLAPAEIVDLASERP